MAARSILGNLVLGAVAFAALPLCGVTCLRVETAATVLTLAIPDPTHVQMRNAPSELVCGPQDGRSVLVEYAATKAAGGVLRGLEFR